MKEFYSLLNSLTLSFWRDVEELETEGGFVLKIHFLQTFVVCHDGWWYQLTFSIVVKVLNLATDE